MLRERNGVHYPIVMRTISLKLPDDLLAQRESLERALSKESPAGAVSCGDVARDLAGCVRGLPEDLAVNPDYMKDFGQ